MISSDSQNLESYVPVYDVVPEKWEDARAFLAEQLKKITNAVNSKEIGFFLDQELLSGKAFIPGVNIATDGGSSQQFRTVLRKVIDFGALPNSATKSVPHGIFFDANFTLIDMWISATDSINLLAFTLAYWSNSSPGSIILNMDNTNINVTTTSDYSAYTRSFVVCEYMQEL